MKYETILKDIPTEKTLSVTLNDGQVIQCKRIPLRTLEQMDSFLGGMKNAASLSEKGLGFLATCGKTKLYSAVGDPSTYMRSGGRTLSSSVNSKGRITGQPGFIEAGVTKEGLQAASSAAKALPWIGLAITVVETGVKVVMKEKELKANQAAFYDAYRKDMGKHANNLWVMVNDYPNAMKDEAVRTANYVTINNAFNDANNAFKELVEDSSKGKRINGSLVHALKGVLDLDSFAYLMKIMYINKEQIDTFPEYVEAAKEDLEAKTDVYNKILERYYEQSSKDKDKHGKILRGTQYNNAAKDKKSIFKRIGLDLVSGGVAELLSVGSKIVGKKVNEGDAELLENLKQIRAENNPYAECIENVGLLISRKNAVLRDDEFLYYQAN